MSTNHPHLIRRGSTYRFRRRLPDPINGMLSRTHFDVSLKTSDPARARILARRLAVAIDRLAEHLRIMPDQSLPTPGCPSSEQSGRFESAVNGGFGSSGLAV
jgi:hypothetical protein